MATKVNGLIQKVNPGDGTQYSVASTAYGYCETAAATTAKVVDMTGFTLLEGTTIHVKFKYNNTASSPTLNVNGTGAKPIVQYGTSAVGTADQTSGWYAGAVISFTYDGTSWVRDQGFNTNSTYWVESIYTSTAAATAAKVGTSTNYTLEAGKYFQVLVVYSNTAQSALTLNINGKGAKPIYINGIASSSSNYTLPSGYYMVYYDGTNYYFRTDNLLTADITGNAATATTATTATKDSGGNVIKDTYVKKAGDTMTGRLTAAKGFVNLLTGSGTAAADNGSSDTSTRYKPAKWTFDAGVTVADGDIFTVKIPVAGHDYGVYMSVNNGTNYYPIVLNGTGRLTTHYPVSNYITVVFESAGSAASIFPLNGGMSRTTISNGAFRVINYYDSNSNYGYTLRMIYPNIKAGSNKIFPYSLIMQNKDGRWESVVTSSSTGTSKAKNTHGFMLSEVWLMYANATYNENVNVGTYNIYTRYTDLFDARYSFNVSTSSGFTGYKPVYLVGTIGSDGLFYLADSWWTQTLPTTDDGKIYIYLGDAYDTYRMTLHEVNTAYIFRDSRIQPYDARGIKTITRSGTTFTATRDDGTTFTFDQQDSNSGGTVTKVTAGTGLSIGSTAGGSFTTTGTINHTNAITAQTTQAVYPIKIDAQGHISAYGSAITSMTPTSHAHGNITNDGKMNSPSTTQATIATGDRLVLVDSDTTAGNKIVPSSISFDTSTTDNKAKALTQYGTWETFNNYTLPTASTTVIGGIKVGTGLSIADAVLSLADTYGDTKNPYGSKTANTVLAAPDGANGLPSFRSLTATDIPNLSAAKITSGTLPIARGGTGKTTAAEAWTALGGGDSGKHADNYYALASHGTHVTYGTSATAVSTTAAAGSASTVSRSDHVHSISLATGDNNGQVKIAGTNVSVKGLGSAAYTDSTAYATSGHNHDSVYLKLIGGTLSGDLTFQTSTADSPDIVWKYGNTSTEQARIWMGSGGDTKFAPNYRCYASDGTSLYSGKLVLGDGTGASGTWGISVSGNAGTATKLATARTISLTGSVTGSGTFDGSGNLSIATTTNHNHDSSYLKLSGGTMTGVIDKYLASADAKPLLRINSNNQDATLWYIGHGTAAGSTPSNSYRLVYKGTGTAPNNYLQLIAHNSADVTAMQMDESGNITLGAKLTLKADPASAMEAATKQYVDSIVSANDALVFKGTIAASGATVTTLPATHKQGWTYKVADTGIYAGVQCEPGDTIYCITDGTAANDAHWAVIQANVDAPLYKDGNTYAGSKLLASDGTGGKVKETTLSNHSFTPSGSVESASLTPSGTVSTTVTVNTTTVNSITAVGTLPTFTQGTFNTGSLPSLTMTVTNEVLSFTWSAGTLPSHAADSFTQGTLPTKGSNTTVATGIKSANSTFSGTAASHSHTFSGTGVNLSHTLAS